MSAKILQQNGHVVYRSTYRGLNDDELVSQDHRKRRDAFDDAINARLGGTFTLEEMVQHGIETPTFDRCADDDEGTHDHVPDIDDVTPEEQDNYVGAEVNLPIGGDMRSGRVIRRARNSDGELEGTANKNPILDTRTYTVEFPDGQLGEYSANVIAENMYSMCDPMGNQQMLFDAITEHQKDGTALDHADRFVVVNGKQHLRKTTKGWKLCVTWKNGSTSWERLADLKESYPIEVAEYAVAQGVDNEPAFAWWVPHVLKKRDRIIAAVNSRYHRQTHKFGVEVPKTIRRALEIDKENGNTLWQDAIEKEMRAVRIAFKILEDKEKKVPVGYQFIDCHMVFSVKLDGFQRKCRLVAGGHKTETPAAMTYSSVVSRETVRIALTIAALNDLDVKASDIKNAYITAPCEEKIACVLGPEFGKDEGKTAIIVRALYGLKSAGASYSKHLADCMRHLGYKPCKADSDLWMRPETRPDDGLEYYSYILLYVDDALAIGHDPMKALHELDHYFMMKPGSIGDPDIYLGAKMRKVRLENGVEAWAMCPAKYIQDAVKNVETYFEKHKDKKYPKKVTAPWPTDYIPETDTSPELKSSDATFFHTQIGVLQWIVELGRIDVITEVSKLSSHRALPREGHLQALFQVFAFLSKKHNSRSVFDPTYPEIDESQFPRNDWTSFYGDVKEAIPMDAPTPKGKEVVLRMYVDSDHAGDRLTRRSRTGFVIFLNSALIRALSKKQATIETSVFGAEFVALKQGLETLRGIRYKLRMMGVPIEGPSYVYGDNMSVVTNTQKPESTLKKKSSEIAYHFCREAVAMGECVLSHIASEDNPADIATKIIGGGQKREHLVRKMLYDIYDCGISLLKSIRYPPHKRRKRKAHEIGK